jgi:hypothetical protein
MGCPINLSTGQSPNVLDTASDPLWQIFDAQQDIFTGPAVPIGAPVWGPAPQDLHWIATQAGANSGGSQYPVGDYIFQAVFHGDAGTLSFRVKADNAVRVLLNGTLLLTWGDPAGANTSGWQTFSPWQSVTSGLQAVNKLDLIVHNANPPSSNMGVLLEGSFDASSGSVGFVQSTFGTKGNFEIVTPNQGGGIAHRYRDNDQSSLPWHGPTAVFGAANQVEAVSLIHSFFNNLELVARIGAQLAHFYRDSQSGIWHGPLVFAFGSGVPSLIQNSSGDFIVVTPLATGGMAQYRRDNAATGFPWLGPAVIAGPDVVEAVSLIQSSYGGNLEVVARIGDRLAHFFQDASSGIWHGPSFFASGVSGAPALIQSRFGSPGNFEVVAPLAAGGMAHFWRDNSDSAMPWYGPTPFGLGRVDATALIQGNYGDNLEVVAIVGCYGLSHYYRPDRANWSGPNVIVP